jgi:hypothetical protein
MDKNPSRVLLAYDRPAAYQISAYGRIDPSWADRLEDMTISQATYGADGPITILEGNLSDQSALAGVLNTLYELHLTILLVKRLETDDCLEHDGTA